MFKRKNNLFSMQDASDDEFKSLFIDIEKEIDTFSEKIGHCLSEEEIVRFLINLMIPIGRNGFLNEERKLKIFYACEKMGIHVLPTHFYSTVPHVCELPEELWFEDKQLSTAPVNFNIKRCEELLGNLNEYVDELKEIALDKTCDRKFYWNNPAISAVDASIYYCMLRHFKPRRCIEIGSGYSTLLAAKAAVKNQNTVFEAIEPYPFEFLKEGIDGLSQLTAKKIQEVDFEYFDKLEDGDILFVDNSHVCKIGSDVNHIILKILPRLKKGVIIHFHDIFLPYELPKNWVKEKALFWNEEYLLQALLQGGENFETLLPVYYLGKKFSEKLVPVTGTTIKHYSGGSYWIRKMR